ncbi:LysR family transcriptional regulator [Aliamphritea spongicola]|nr:LysR family transcriptional regulator [Aliamphritea spongicola]
MNIEHLKLFVRLATTQNISQAGYELGLSPAVASLHINKLEDGLGVRLLHRTTRKVSLTEEGLAFLPHAEDVLASVEAARASVGAGKVSPSGTLRVTAPASFGRMHLVPALEGFLTVTRICRLISGFQIRLSIWSKAGLILRSVMPS